MKMGLVGNLSFQATPLSRFKDGFRIPGRSLFAIGDIGLIAGCSVVRISFKAAAEFP
jgi:hypothetical protein